MGRFKESAIVMLGCLVIAAGISPARANVISVQLSEDLGEVPIAPSEGSCAAQSDCINQTNFATGNSTDGRWKNDGHVNFPNGGTSHSTCCSADGTTKQRLVISASADNGSGKDVLGNSAGPGPTDCRDTPVYDDRTIGCKAGGDNGMTRAFSVRSLGQVYRAEAWVKLTGVNEPQPGMFRARLTIHGYAGSEFRQECNAFLDSSVITGLDGNPLPGTEDQTQTFVPLEIPSCPMDDPEIDKVDVAVRANLFKNDIAYGTVLVQKIVFTRLS